MSKRRAPADDSGPEILEHHSRDSRHAKRLRPANRPSPSPAKLPDVQHGDRGLSVVDPRDRLSRLPTELLIRILSFMTERQLLDVTLVSKSLHRLASDSHLWRSHYYQRFVAPRVHLIPGYRTAALKGVQSSTWDTQSHRAVWADEEHRRRRPRRAKSRHDKAKKKQDSDSTDWKKVYILRHNWTRGRCAVDEVPVHDSHWDDASSSDTKTMVRVVDGLAVTVDWARGLRCWDLRTRRLIGEVTLETDDGLDIQPTCLAVDEQRLHPSGVLDISIGFEDGSFGVWRLDTIGPDGRKIGLLNRHYDGCMGKLVALAYRAPYLFTATSMGFISLYTFDQQTAGETWQSRGSRGATVQSSHSLSPDILANTLESASNDMFTPLPSPCLLTCLKSNSTRPPLALSIRPSAASTVASIAYSFDTIGGWCIGIQDLDIKAPDGLAPDVVTSRVAYTLPTQTRYTGRSSPHTPLDHGSPSNAAYSSSSESEDDGPTRLSYSHPYLLATLPDNTLALHLCTTTAGGLSISNPRRLCGHTSGISDAEITTRGKAVSVSTRGDEIRVWELEGRVGGSSVEVRPRRTCDRELVDVPGNGRSPAGISMRASTPTVMDDRKEWVGFDDEMVIVLKSSPNGRESLMLYDFT